MNTWIEMLIALSVAGSTLVVCILILKYITEDGFSAKWNYLIRKVAVLFFLVPVWFIVQKILSLSTKSINAISTMQVDYLQGAISEQYVSSESAIAILTVWGLGVLFFGGWHVYCYVKFSKEMKDSNVPVMFNSEAYQLLIAGKDKLRISGNIQLVYNDKILSPALIGLFKPMIMLPSREIPAVELSMVLRHELIHFKRRDLWMKSFMLIASSLHWFNPFVHLLRKEMHIWSELSCDEQVVIDMSYIERKQYGETILNLLEEKPRITGSFSVLLAGNKKNLKRRLMKMLNVKKMKKSVVLIAIIVFIAIGAIGATASVLASIHAPTVNAESKDADMTYEEYVEWLENYSYDQAVESGVTPNSRESFRAETEKMIEKVKAMSKEDREGFMYYMNNPEEVFKAAADSTNSDVYWD